MNKSNSDQVAKILLWQICGLRAETASMKAQLDGVMDALGKSPSEQFVKECELRDAATQRELFREASLQAGLSDELPDSPGSDSRN
jgi:hypothetical protein